MPREDRARLVEAAQDSMSGKLEKFGFSQEPANHRALQIARDLSGIDYPARSNSFTAAQLRDAYQRDAEYRHLLEIGPQMSGPSLT